MKIPRFWAQASYTTQDRRGKAHTFAAWRWSDSSVEDAQQQARAAAQQIALKFASGQSLDRYGYGVRPLREELLQAISGPPGADAGIVTRNSYGALVLNAAQALFADIDFPEQGSAASLAGGLRRLFGQKAPDPAADALQKVEAWAQRHPGLGLRVYRTAAGLRCLATSDLFDPAASSTRELLAGLNSDPLYIRLCHEQECFRARLTPKPWRLGMHNPPARFPWRSPFEESKQRHWEAQYQMRSSAYTTCRLLRQIGPAGIHPQVAAILHLHDRLACNGDHLQLA